jgi:hypothetical protein
MVSIGLINKVHLRKLCLLNIRQPQELMLLALAMQAAPKVL